MRFERQNTAATGISEFWPRVFAFLIDGVVLMVLFLLIGYLFREIFFAMGPYGRLIAYAIIIPYLGYFNSEKNSGQTIGKRITNIAVVDKDNHYLSLGKSFLRAFILGLIFMLNGWRLPILNNPILAFITTVIVFGGLLSLIYTFIFNRTTRQGIHDLVVGSYVVPAPPAPEMVRPEIPRIHRRFTYGLVGVGLLLGIAGLAIQAVRPSGFVTLEEGELAELTELQTALMDTGEFYSVNVVRQNRRSLQGGDVLRDLNIDMWAKRTCLGNPDYCNETVAWAARTAFEYFDGIEDLSGMRVAVVNRFDLGITSGTLSQGAAWSIEDWHQELLD